MSADERVTAGGLSAEEMRRAEDACRTCPSCDVGMTAGCNCDPEPRAVIAYLLTEVERLANYRTAFLKANEACSVRELEIHRLHDILTARAQPTDEPSP